MPDHECNHEADLAVMSVKVNNTEETVQKIYKILTGNGESGLVTKTALNAQSNRRLWWFVSILTGGIFGAVFYIIRSGIV